MELLQSNKSPTVDTVGGLDSLELGRRHTCKQLQAVLCVASKPKTGHVTMPRHIKLSCKTLKLFLKRAGDASAISWPFPVPRSSSSPWPQCERCEHSTSAQCSQEHSLTAGREVPPGRRGKVNELHTQGRLPNALAQLCAALQRHEKTRLRSPQGTCTSTLVSTEVMHHLGH